MVDIVNYIHAMTSPTDLALLIDRLMRKIHADLHPRAAEFDYEQVGPIGGMLLLTIGESEPLQMQSVVAKMGRDKSQITRLIQNLERKGLVQKQRRKEDAREIVLVLTPAGREQLKTIQSALSEVVAKIFEPLSSVETHEFYKVLSRLLDTSEKTAARD